MHVVNRKKMFVMLITLLTICLAQFNDSNTGSNLGESNRNLSSGMPGMFGVVPSGIPSSFINGGDPKSEIPSFDLGKIKGLSPNKVPLSQQNQNGKTPLSTSQPQSGVKAHPKIGSPSTSDDVRTVSWRAMEKECILVRYCICKDFIIIYIIIHLFTYFFFI